MKNAASIICKIIILLSLIFTCSHTLMAQTVLLNVDRGIDSVRTDRGPNLKKFAHSFFEAGFVTPPQQIGAAVNYGRSCFMAMGVRTKFKLSGLLSLGWEIKYDLTTYNLSQNKNKQLPDTIKNKTEKINHTGMLIGIFTRINFDVKRGNVLGRFLDLGINTGFKNTKHIIKNTLPDGSQIKTEAKKVPYRQPFYYNVFARLSSNRFALYTTYRLSDYFKTTSTYHLPELPRMQIGVDVGLY